MPERTRRDAHRRLLETTRTALRCLVDVHVHTRNTAYPDVAVIAHQPDTARLRTDRALAIEVLHYFRFAQDSASLWDIATAGYSYRLMASSGDQSSDWLEVFAYQYHPLETPDVDFPHLHVHAGAIAGDRALTRVHFRTGRIGLGDFLRVLVRDFGVIPKAPYAEDFLSILDETDRAFRALEHHATAD